MRLRRPGWPITIWNRPFVSYRLCKDNENDRFEVFWKSQTKNTEAWKHAGKIQVIETCKETFSE